MHKHIWSVYEMPSESFCSWLVKVCKIFLADAHPLRDVISRTAEESELQNVFDFDHYLVTTLYTIYHYWPMKWVEWYQIRPLLIICTIFTSQKVGETSARYILGRASNAYTSYIVILVQIRLRSNEFDVRVRKVQGFVRVRNWKKNVRVRKNFVFDRSLVQILSSTPYSASARHFPMAYRTRL